MSVWKLHRAINYDQDIKCSKLSWSVNQLRFEELYTHLHGPKSDITAPYLKLTDVTIPRCQKRKSTLSFIAQNNI